MELFQEEQLLRYCKLAWVGFLYVARKLSNAVITKRVFIGHQYSNSWS